MTEEPDWIRVEFDALIEGLVPFAQEMLELQGEFYPFGGYVDGSGEVCMLGAELEDEQPDRKDVHAFLVEGFRAEASDNGYLATAICADGRAQRPDTAEVSDAVIVQLEHRDGAAINFALPYIKVRNEVTYGEPFGFRSEPTIFGEAFS